MNSLSRLILVLVLLLATGTASATAGNPGVGKPVVTKSSGTFGFPVVVPTARCPGFAPDPLVFDSVTLSSLVKYWYEAPGYGEWIEVRTKWSGSMKVGDFTYTLRGHLFLSTQAPPGDEYGSGTFVLRRSDGARMSGDVVSLSYAPQPPDFGNDFVVVWGEVRCRSRAR